MVFDPQNEKCKLKACPYKKLALQVCKASFISVICQLSSVIYSKQLTSLEPGLQVLPVAADRPAVVPVLVFFVAFAAVTVAFVLA